MPPSYRRHMLRHAIVRELGKFRGRAMAPLSERRAFMRGGGGEGIRPTGVQGFWVYGVWGVACKWDQKSAVQG